MQPAYFRYHNHPKLVRSWAYQLQGEKGASLNLNPITQSSSDLAVIDYSRNGAESGEFTRAEINAVRKS
ncbi:MAG TPA: hypothetical protein V6C57_29435, partial [Coleofasciculaceae cyanobacterium]